MIRAELADIAREQPSTSDLNERPEVPRPRHLGDFMRAARPARIATSVSPDAGGQMHRLGR